MVDQVMCHVAGLATKKYSKPSMLNVEGPPTQKKEKATHLEGGGEKEKRLDSGW
jgi:hypothetical protein